MATLTSTPSVGPASGPDQTASLFPARDRQLVSECLAGHPAAWDIFLDRFGGLFSFVVDRTAAQRRIAVSAADRDDLLADIVLELLQRDAAVLRSFRGNSTLATYLVVVARRLAVRSLDRLAERRRGAGADAAQVCRDDVGPARHDDREEIEVMLSQLARTDPAGAEMLRLHHLEGRSYGEISRLTGVPLGSIGPMLARARHKMRERDE
jgi:RNA polymerase sigma-70 factor (ECF subfamily)